MIFLATAVAFGLLFAGLFGAAHVYLNSAGFQTKVLSEIAERLHCEVRLEQMKIRLHRGADLVNIRVTSEQFRPREFMKAERLRLRYDLYEALFHQRVVLEELKFSTPVIEINLVEPVPPSGARTASRPARRETLEPSTAPSAISESAIVSAPAPKFKPTVAPKALGATESRWPSPPAVDLRSFVIEDGSLNVALSERDRVLLQGAQIHAAFSTDPIPNALGSLLCKRVDLPQWVKLSDLKCDFLWREDSVSVNKLTADLLGGSLEAGFKVEQTANGLSFESQIAAANLWMDQVVKFASALGAGRLNGSLLGRLRARASFRGSLAHPELVEGQGQVWIQNGRLVDVVELKQLGGLLNRPSFRDLPLDKCEIDFILESGRLQIAQVEIRAAEMALTGEGTVNLLDGVQDLQMKLAFARELARRFPSEALAGATRRADGWTEIAFFVKGTAANPVSDLTARFAPLAKKAYGGSVFDTIFEAVPSREK